jgi:hypothetical protein
MPAFLPVDTVAKNGARRGTAGNAHTGLILFLKEASAH